MSWLYLDLMFYFFFSSFFFPLQTELSHNLQQLSEKARSTTEFIQRLKGMSDKVTVCIYTYITYIYSIYVYIFFYFNCLQESCMEFERLVHAQCEALIQAIHDRREYLLEAIRNDKDTKIRILKVCSELSPTFSSLLSLPLSFSIGSTIELHRQIATDNGLDSVLH